MASNNSQPYLDPLWRRVVLIAACAAWAIFEIINGSTFWAAMVGFVTVYGAWTYLYKYEPTTATFDKDRTP